MDYEIEIEVFRAGDYGPRGAWSENDLDQIATDYAPQRHEAPVTLDHSQHGPALGWVRALRRVGRTLVARLGGLNAEFLKGLKDGAFKKRSVELYRRAPGTGRPYLRAVSFLGAATPAVKGLADPVFSEDEPTEPIEFQEDKTPENGDTHSLPPDFSTPVSPSPSRSEIPESVVAFCERLRRDGRLLPSWETQGLRTFLAALDDTEPLAFTEPDPEMQPLPKTRRAWFQEFLESLVPLVPLGETVPTPSDTADSPTAWSNFSDPGPIAAGFDPRSVALHQRVCRLRHTHPHLSYSEALGTVAAF